ncbi:DUF3656 domain-containing U32 family peptidase [Sporanaerobacter acetigenes]|uniref:DUF3656 domain-containing U32 family peptidase n=1 Tax=Sporanaerobacter acetigenes TaxID=165813 RepID=UPI001E581231|nr:U32 family peptidase [Sporanaerobacter acetigenes]
MVKNNSYVELLSPVGNIEALYAAVQNGADAVYLGGKLFNARQYASNFGMEDLKTAVEYAHLRGVRVYVTVNILFSDKEIEEAVDYIKYLYEIDVDGLIVQDLGLSYLIKNVFPQFELHGSTQMTINNLQGVLFLEQMGFKRVVLARELSINEIKYIKERSNIELEGFIHGALCVCYSGQCLMSSIIGGRSGNRGTCAQPCRMPYTLVDIENERTVFEKLEGKYILSPKDLNTIEDIDKIVDSGLKSLKIEGRMKKPEYVALVVSKYRKALDRGIDEITKEDKKELLEIFNRGFTGGYILENFGREFISLDRPNNRGVYLGKVVKVDPKYIYINLEDDLNIGDGIEFTKGKNEYVGIMSNISGEKGSTIKIDNLKGIKNNSLVYKTSNRELLEKTRETFEENQNIKYPISMDVYIYINKKAVLIIKDENYTISVESEELVEKAQRVSLIEERVRNQLEKLSDEPYYIDNLNIYLEEGSFLPISSLNKLRRQGIDLLNEKRKNFNHRAKIDESILEERVQEFFRFKNESRDDLNKKLSVKVSKIEQFEKLDLNKLDRIYLGFDDDLENCLNEIKKRGKEAYIYTDKILNEDELKKLNGKLEQIYKEVDGISVSNLGTLNLVKNNFELNIHGDIGLNVYNSITARALNENRVNSITLSPELTLQQIKEICKKGENIYETIGYGYLPLMVTKHCPISLAKGCQNNKNCKYCKYRTGYGLKDRLGKVFPIVRNESITTIYNSVPLMVIEELNNIYDSGVNMIRIDYTFEEDDIYSIQEAFYEYIHGNLNERDLEMFLDFHRKNTGLTRGHYFRGVL